MSNQREDLNNKTLIEDRFIEIKNQLRTGEMHIFHNYDNIDNAIKTLENVIVFLKLKKQKDK
jgi:hypothetical protein